MSREETVKKYIKRAVLRFFEPALESRFNQEWLEALNKDVEEKNNLDDMDLLVGPSAVDKLMLAHLPIQELTDKLWNILEDATKLDIFDNEVKESEDRDRELEELSQWVSGLPKG